MRDEAADQTTPAQDAIEFDGERYRQASAMQKAWGARLISELSLRGDETILDVGCGDGALSAQLADLVPRGRVVGLDASSGMIDAARAHQRANLSFVLQDVTAATFEGEFDLVFTNAALHWVLDHERLLQVLHRALKPGGVLRANFGGEGNCPAWFRVARELIASDEFRDAFRGFRWPYYMPSVAEYEQLLETSPFTSADVWLENADKYFPDVDTMLRWLEQPSIVPFLQHLDAPTAARFHAAAAARMTEETRQPDGRCFEAFRRINVLARK